MKKKTAFLFVTLLSVISTSSCALHFGESVSQSTSNSESVSISETPSLSSETPSSSSDSTSQSTSQVPTKDGYSLYWSDEFSGDTLNTSNWTAMVGDGSDYGIAGWGNNEQQYYTSREDNLEVKDGNLIISGVNESYRNKNYTSARIRSAGKVSTRYGYIEARISLPAIQGMWPAFWMLPESDTPYGGWASSGEIDIMEAKGRINDATSGALHYGQVGSSTYKSKSQFFDKDTIESFHTYAISWAEESIMWYVDDEVFMTINKGTWFSEKALDNLAAPFDWDFHILLNLAIGGNFDGGLLPPDDFEYAQMKVDYVRIFKAN